MTHTFTFKGVVVTVDYNYSPAVDAKFNDIDNPPEPMSLDINEVFIKTNPISVNITSFLSIEEFKDELENALLKEIDPITFRHL